MNITPVEALTAQAIGHPTKTLSRPDIARYQAERLQTIIDYCRQHSSFYCRKFADAAISTITGLDDLATLPFTTENDLRKHGTEMICVSQDAVARIITMHSSGTTGAPKRLFFTEKDLAQTLDFFQQGMQPLVDPGQKVAILLPGATPDSTGHLLAQALHRMEVSSHILGLVDDPGQAARQLGKIRPDVLVGFPVQILAIARMATSMALPLGTIRSVLLCSDYVPENLCRQVSDLLACEIFTHYGTVETGLGGGVDCAAHRGTHLREADLLFEIIDPQTATPLPDGTWGEIVFTTLTRTGMPLIRYRTGDMGRLLSGPCPCGSHIRLLDKVQGRINQVHTLQNGRQLALHALDEILFSVPGLLDFRASLTTDQQHDRLLIQLVTVPGNESETVHQVQNLVAHCRPTQGLKCIVTPDSSAKIHRSKRILEDKRQEKNT